MELVKTRPHWSGAPEWSVSGIFVRGASSDAGGRMGRTARELEARHAQATSGTTSF